MSVIRRIFAFVWHALDVLRRTLHLILLLVLFAIAFAAFRQSLPMVPSRAALVVKPEGALVEELSGSAFDRAVGGVRGDREPQTLVTDVVEAIRAGAKDSRIQALVLETEDLTGGGLAKLNAIAGAIAEFRKRGKKVYAWGQYVTQQQYYLMAQADEVWLEPSGAVGIDGYASFQPFFKDGLDKLGVAVNVVRAGEFKSFGEPYVRNDMSPGVKAETGEWLGALWSAYQAGVSGPRALKPGAVDAYVENALPLLRATQGDAALLAEQQRLVTGRKTRAQFEQWVAKAVGEDDDSHSFNAVRHDDYLRVVRSNRVLERHPGGTVVVITATGTIRDGEQAPGDIGGDTLANVLRDARYDDDVKAIVLRVDSGGGSVLASEVIRQEVEATREAGKPVVASFSSVAASGAYYFSTAANEIWAEPTTITGSIGVIAIVPTFQGLLGKLGVNFDGAATSRLAADARLDRDLSPQLRVLLQLGVDHEYRNFVQLVADSRKRKFEEIDALAQGRVWIGSKALELGLVDHLGGLPDAIRAAAKLAKLDEGKYGIDRREQPLGWREALMRDLSGSVRAGAERLGLLPAQPPYVRRALAPLERELARLAAFNDPRDLYFYCNCTPP